MTDTALICDRLERAVNQRRLVETAVRLISVPSPTGEGGAVADCLAELLQREGFLVSRSEASHPAAPAVVVRFDTDRPGRTLQFNSHLDTVHLPFVPPQVDGDRLTGSGSSDMKAGLAASVEALRILRETEALPGGRILLTAHDLHESPWGRGQQLDQLIADRVVGDAVLLPEYLHECLPVIGRGGTVWKAVIRRQGPPVHEVMRPADEPSVLAAGAALATRLGQLHERLALKTDPLAGSESVFLGQMHGGEIYNQFAQECWLEGTRRWLPGTRRAAVEAELRDLFAQTAAETRTQITAEFTLMRDAFQLDRDDPFVTAFQEAYTGLVGAPLPIGAKPFCDDGNSFWAGAGIPAITHGPRAGGAHTLKEWVSIKDLVRVAQVYALTAVAYCGRS